MTASFSPSPVKRFAVAHNVNDHRVQAVLARRKFIHGPVILLVMLAGRHQDRQLHQTPSDVGFERFAPCLVERDLRRPRARGRKLAAVKNCGHLRLRFDQGQAASRIRVDVIGRSEGQRQELLHLRGHLLIERGQSRGRPRVLSHQ